MKAFVFIILMSCFTQFCISQTTISRNYGSVQNVQLIFHDGIDIPMQSNDIVTAFKDGEIVFINGDNPNGYYEYEIFIQTDGLMNEIIGYAHIKQDPSLLYFCNTNTWPATWLYTGMTVQAGDPLGRVWDHNDIGRSHDHIHIDERTQVPNNNNLQNGSCVNPLLSTYIGYIDNSLPEIGLMFIQHEETPNQWEYLTSGQDLYGNLKISREIIDHMGGQFHNPLTEYINDPDIWPTIPAFSQRYNGYTAAPYRVEFGIENEWQQHKYPEGLRWRASLPKIRKSTKFGSNCIEFSSEFLLSDDLIHFN